MNKIVKCVIYMVCFSLLSGLVNFKMQENLQKNISKEILRFHVVANSDKKEDQELKMKVKDAILEYFSEALPRGLDGQETKLWVREHMEEIEETGRELLRKNGSDMPLSAAVTTTYFPDKELGDTAFSRKRKKGLAGVTFPAGEYTALCVEIGSARGQNWWGLLYPDLCLEEASGAKPEEKSAESMKEETKGEEASGDMGKCIEKRGRDVKMKLKLKFKLFA